MPLITHCLHDHKSPSPADTVANAFKASALPLHVNITHTPPVAGDDDTQDVAQIDPGFIGSMTLVPSTFGGDFGWTATKELTVELLNDGSAQTEKKKVQVLLMSEFMMCPV